MNAGQSPLGMHAHDEHDDCSTDQESKDEENMHAHRDRETEELKVAPGTNLARQVCSFGARMCYSNRKERQPSDQSEPQSEMNDTSSSTSVGWERPSVPFNTHNSSQLSRESRECVCTPFERPQLGALVVGLVCLYVKLFI
jgi:hypothetical protein